jgi:hypothetical protein
MLVVLGHARSATEIAKLIAHRRYQLGISSRDLDQIAGLADGHTSKNECGIKKLGDISLPALLATLGLKLAVLADDESLPFQTLCARGTSKPPRRSSRTTAAPKAC